jgi:hypothetical protein
MIIYIIITIILVFILYKIPKHKEKKFKNKKPSLFESFKKLPSLVPYIILQ